MADETSEPPQDPVAEVRRRRAATKTKEPPPDPATPTPTEHSVALSPGVPSFPTSGTGISHHALGGPATVVGSFVTEGVASSTAGEYATPQTDGYYSSYPRGARQPTTVLAWKAGQLVRRDVYERYGGANAASTPAEARPVNDVADGLVVPHR